MHLLRILAKYFEYYNGTRCHLSLAGDAPETRDIHGPELGEVIEYSTLRRYAQRELGFGGPRVTVRLADTAPGEEAQVDFGHVGWIVDVTGDCEPSLEALSAHRERPRAPDGSA